MDLNWARLRLPVFHSSLALRNATGRRRLPTTSVCAVIIPGSDNYIGQTASMRIPGGGATPLARECPGTIILLEICAVHESAYGTKRTSRGCVPMSAFGGKADIALRCPNVRF